MGQAQFAGLQAVFRHLDRRHLGIDPHMIHYRRNNRLKMLQMRIARTDLDTVTAQHRCPFKLLIALGFDLGSRLRGGKKNFFALLKPDQSVAGLLIEFALVEIGVVLG